MKIVALMGGFLVLGGCGGDDAITIDNLARHLAAAHCAQIDRCCDAEEVNGLPDDCVGFLTPIFEEEADIIDMRASIAAGRLELDEDQAARCLEHVHGLTCGEFSAYIQEKQAATGRACLDMLVGLVPLGGVCAESYDCTTGVCDFDPDLGEQRCGLPIPAGGSCSDSCEDRFECRQCEGALLCDQTTLTCTAAPAILPGTLCNGA